jgi:phosphoribosylanthranilate isomerase
MRVRVKVCGITTYEDAVLALELGADALGFNFCPGSPRFLDFASARGIIRRLPPLASWVGVFANVAEPAEVDRRAREAGVQVLQLHGEESASYCRALDAWPRIKAIRIRSGEMVPPFPEDYPVQAILFDSWDRQQLGGTGKIFDWARVEKSCCLGRVILAGGLNERNVVEAIRSVRPYAVDVCSGVESFPGRKDAAKLAAFMKEVSDASR